MVITTGFVRVVDAMHSFVAQSLSIYNSNAEEEEDVLSIRVRDCDAYGKYNRPGKLKMGRHSSMKNLLFLIEDLSIYIAKKLLLGQ